MPRGKVLAIGTFDGVHLGHQKILRVLLRVARQKKLTPIVAVFPYSPRLYLKGKKNVVRLLTTIKEREAILAKEFGISDVWEFPLDRHFLKIPAEDFLRDLAEKWRVKDLVCGENFSLGKGRSCTMANFKNFAQEMGIDFHIARLCQKGVPVSSTRIRGLLAEGDFRAANRLLGRPYFLSGKVIRGQRIASKLLGFPTANVKIDPRKMLPLGVFFGWVRELRRWALINIGYRPTLSKQQTEPRVLTTEAHILKFKGDLYGKELTIELRKKLREEKSFATLETLRQQIIEDIQSARGYLKYN